MIPSNEQLAALISKKVDESIKKRLSETNILSLGDLISSLQKAPLDKNVCYDFCDIVPTVFDSYRGIYAHLALGFSQEESCTVEQLLRKCEGVCDTTQEGYKGGEFIMSLSTPIWVANYGRSHGTAIVGVNSDSWNVILETAHIEL